ncbi:MAG: ParB/RepB/Spo0J family partition protein [Spirochaetales bacterium]|nr:ParB/RepB/Spo0J family partition protein [Spirochaetales bacterium]
MSKINALGSGLDSLIVNLENDDNSGVQEVSIDIVKPNPFQPRNTFNDETIAELSESILSCGLIQPILVEESFDGGYIIIAGERRYRASKLAGLSKIPVIIKNLSEEEKLEIALVENIQREDLTPIEEAKAYKKLMDSMNLNQDDVAKKVGKKRSTISNAIRLLNLPEDIQNSVNTGEISAGHARALLSLETDNSKRVIFNKIKNENLSVRATEKIVKDFDKIKKSENSEKIKSNPDIQYIEQQFIDAFGTKVQLKGSLDKGKIEISYFSKDDLSRIVEILGN